MDKNVENLFTGVWGLKNNKVSIYYKYRKDRIECNEDMYYRRISKFEKEYKNNSVKLHIINTFESDIIDEIDTITFDGNDKINISSLSKKC